MSIRNAEKPATVFTPEEIERFKAECFRTWGIGKRMYQQSAYIFMLNTGLRTGEMLGLLNSDVDLENRVVHVRQGVKEIPHREGTESTSGREVAVGKPKSASNKRVVPLNDTAIAMVEELRGESYFGPDSGLACRLGRCLTLPTGSSAPHPWGKNLGDCQRR